MEPPLPPSLHWQPESIPLGNATPLVAGCATANDCVVMGTYGTAAFSADRGKSWRRLPNLEGTANDLSCRAGTCIMVSAGGGVYISQDGGRTWAARVVPASIFAVTPMVPSLVAATCATRRTCLVVASADDYSYGERDTWVLRTVNGGTTWTIVTTGVPRGLYADTVSCRTAEYCYLGGAIAEPSEVRPGGLIVHSHDAGATWNYGGMVQSGMDPGPDNASAINCPSSSECYAVGAGPVLAGTSGVYPAVPTGPAYLSSRIDAGPRAGEMWGEDWSAWGGGYYAST